MLLGKREIILFVIFCFELSSGTAQVLSYSQKTVTPIIIEKNNNDKFYIRNETGMILLNDIDSIGGYENDCDYYIVKKEEKYGIYSRFGKELIPVSFNQIKRVIYQFWIVKLADKYGLYNISIPQSIPAIYDSIITTGRYNADFIVKKGTKYGIFNTSFNEIIPIIYDEIRQRSGNIELILNNEKFYLISNKIVKTNIITEKTFRIYGDFIGDTKTYYVFVNNGKYGIMNNDASIILSPQYDDIIPKQISNIKNLPQNIFIVKQNDKCGIIDLNNHIYVPLEYQSIEFANSDYLIVELENLKYFYDLTNKQIDIDNPFQKYVPLSDFSRIEKDGFETLIDNKTMRKLFPFKYEFVIQLENKDFFSVGINKKYGIIDSKQNEIIPIIYDNPLFIGCEGKIVARKKGNYGIINLKNEILFPFSTRRIVQYSDGFEITKENSFEVEKLDCSFKQNLNVD
jgi:hypothetical protein